MRILLGIILSFCFYATQAQINADQQLKIDVVYLASDYLEGRETGTRGEAMAADYIAYRYQQLGMEVIDEASGYFQSFPFKEVVNPHHSHGDSPREGKGKNVVGYFDHQADKTIVIGAHYDHLGMGASGSLHAGPPAIHNGADDNASGIAAMLLMAEWIKENQLTQSNYLFIAFSGEEMGLFGSKYYAANPTIDLDKISAMINMDMVGRLNDEKVLAVNGVGTAPNFKKMIAENVVKEITAKTTDYGVGPSDHTSFYLKGVPVLHFFTGQHMDYHKPQDDAHLVNYEGLMMVTEYIYDLIVKINAMPQLTFVKTKM